MGNGTAFWREGAKTEAGEHIIGAWRRDLMLPLYEKGVRSTLRLADNDVVFVEADGTPISPAGVTKRMTGLQKAAGVPAIAVHGLRHTIAPYQSSVGGGPEARRGSTQARVGGDHLRHLPPLPRHR